MRINRTASKVYEDIQNFQGVLGGWLTDINFIKLLKMILKILNKIS